MTVKNELFGMKQIQECCSRLGLPSSEASVISMINLSGLPAKKIGGRWISNIASVERWRAGYVEEKSAGNNKGAEKRKKRFGGD